MNLFELKPTTHWNPASTEARSTATIKSDKHIYELVIRCNLSVADHLKGWLDKVLDKKEDNDRGRFVELTNKDNRESFIGVDDIMDKVADEIAKKAKQQNLKYVYLFSTTASRQEKFKKLAKTVAKMLEWEVYEDRNYFLIHRPTLKIHQVD